jgi:3-dehydroquinate synthase
MIKIRKGIVGGRKLPGGFVITDKNVFKNYKRLIEQSGNRYFVIKSGENSKSIETYAKIIKNLKDDNRIISFGGGVVGDIAGFVASTYKRGVPLIQVPTTLLAMVDSSIGGKNGINLKKKKNYLGTIYQPKMVLIDPLFLETLPLNEFRNGIAEIIKYGMIFNKPLLKRIEKKLNATDEDLERIIACCCKIKAKVVELDEQDKGYRHTLNFGHTIGHALELLHNLKHGQAISIGMIKEAELGKRLGLIKDEEINLLRRALNINGLQTELPRGADIDKIIELMKADKKGPLVFALSQKHPSIKIDIGLVGDILKAK